MARQCPLPGLRGRLFVLTIPHRADLCFCWAYAASHRVQGHCLICLRTWSTVCGSPVWNLIGWSSFMHLKQVPPFALPSWPLSSYHDRLEDQDSALPTLTCISSVGAHLRAGRFTGPTLHWAEEFFPCSFPEC